MRVTEVHFNHNPASAQDDALTIRYGNGAVITAPEWRSGASDPVAYVAKTLHSPFTIKAKFTDGPPNGTSEIGAIVGSGEDIFAGFGRPNEGGMQPRVVSFRANGESRLEEFVVVPGPGDDLVNIHDLVLNWRSLDARSSTKFDVTRHRVYVVTSLPTAPWCQGLSEPPDLQFPWVEALEVACSWARGAGSIFRATELITHSINSLPNQTYLSSATTFAPEADGPFNLSQYIFELNNSASFANECRGVAGALATFANLLGNRLCPLQLSPNQGTGTFGTLPIRLLTDSAFQTKTFGRHEVTTKASEPLDDFLPVYDACLELEEASPILAIGMLLGHPDRNGPDYLHRFLASGNVNNRVVIPPRSLVVVP